jgi:hypothetical protein
MPCRDHVMKQAELLSWFELVLEFVAIGECVLVGVFGPCLTLQPLVFYITMQSFLDLLL